MAAGASHLIHSGHLNYHIDFGHQHVEAYAALQHIHRDSYYGGIGEGTPEDGQALAHPQTDFLTEGQHSL